MSKWKIYHRAETVSTNLDARKGKPFEAFTADYQTAGRGRLNHKWESDRGRNVIMSVVLDVAQLSIEESSTLPLVMGLAVAKAVKKILPSAAIALKWPNDVYWEGEKIAGILCERNGDKVIVGIGVNIEQAGYRSIGGDREQVRDGILAETLKYKQILEDDGFAAIYPEIAALDYLKGRNVSVAQTDEDRKPVTGICGGITLDGSLLVGDAKIYAGEAHVTAF